MKNDSFDKKLNEIREILQKLETEDNIDEAIRLHKSGKEQIAKCRDFLQSAKQKIEVYKEEA